MLAELPVLFPNAGNRKLANLWTQRYFAACAASLSKPAPTSVREVTSRYHAQPADDGTDTRIRLVVINDMPDQFRVKRLRQHFPGLPPARIKRVLSQLCAEDTLTTTGHGPGTRWCRCR